MLRIRELRTKVEMTSDELAEKMSLDASTVRKWESGAANPRADKLPAIAEALGCTIGELYGEKPAAAK